ncbi:hypothetical protein N0V90_008679 [Kalmusia sp. IMI 367209]|nr:hypothetical protein N0V90_008679 [Kalmusia sp. IMI 367209]
MSATSKVILILGSGPNVGQHVARAFSAKGYKVAITSRSAQEGDSSSGTLSIATDLSDPESVAQTFSKVKASLGVPSVVVYNAAAGAPVDAKNPLSHSLADFTRSLNVNTISAFAAAQQAIQGFAELPDSASRTFIFTGNILNTTIIPALLAGGAGKSATAHIVRVAASVYSDRGFKFYYADERKPDGSPAYNAIDGEAHGKFYAELSESKSQGPWQQTFVKGEGYKQF